MAAHLLDLYEEDLCGVEQTNDSVSSAGDGMQCEQTKRITTIFFDLDNTLIPTRKGDAKACRKIAELLVCEHGMDSELAARVTTDYLAAFRRCPDNEEDSLEQWRTQLWIDVLPAGYKHLAGRLYARWLDYRTRYLTPSPAVFSMLQTLRLQYLLGAITNGPSAAQWEKIDKLGLGRFFDCILVSADLPWAKPDRNIFQAACRYLGVQPDECAMIGDKLETDVQGGVESKLGLTIWLPLPSELALPHDKTFADLDVDIRPDLVVRDVLELPSVLPPAVTFRQRSPSLGMQQQQKTTRNRAASYNQFLAEGLDSSNSCSSSSSWDSQSSY